MGTMLHQVFPIRRTLSGRHLLPRLGRSSIASVILAGYGGDPPSWTAGKSSPVSVRNTQGAYMEWLTFGAPASKRGVPGIMAWCGPRGTLALVLDPPQDLLARQPRSGLTSTAGACEASTASRHTNYGVASHLGRQLHHCFGREFPRLDQIAPGTAHARRRFAPGLAIRGSWRLPSGSNRGVCRLSARANVPPAGRLQWLPLARRRRMRCR